MIYINLLMEVNFKVKSDIIAFKGVKDGVYLEIKGGDLDLIRDELNKKINKAKKFFKGMKFLGVQSEDLSNKEILEINLLLKYKYGFDISFDELLEDAQKLYIEEDRSPILAEPISESIEEDMTKFVYGTIRSGQAVEYEGNIVVIGDVNPGALLKSKGNIIVLGTLRGVAHAGSEGNLNAIVAAYNLLPNQLRIADLIVRAPDGDISQYKLPEVAKIYEGEVVIEPYLPNK